MITTITYIDIQFLVLSLNEASKLHHAILFQAAVTKYDRLDGLKMDIYFL